MNLLWYLPGTCHSHSEHCYHRGSDPGKESHLGRWKKKNSNIQSKSAFPNDISKPALLLYDSGCYFYNCNLILWSIQTLFKAKMLKQEVEQQLALTCCPVDSRW